MPFNALTYFSAVIIHGFSQLCKHMNMITATGFNPKFYSKHPVRAETDFGHASHFKYFDASRRKKDMKMGSINISD